MRKSLAIKKNDLEIKDKQANEKLKIMVTDQQEAEQKACMSETQYKSKCKVQDKRSIVMQDLAELTVRRYQNREISVDIQQSVRNGWENTGTLFEFAKVH